MEPRLEAEKVMSTDVNTQEEHLQFMEHEIECPRCHDNMDLRSDFDSLYYTCSECDFCLYTIKKNK